MRELTPDGLRIVGDVARRNGVSLEAAVALLRALAAGNGSQAQFNHPDLGGMGQWSRGGMIMVGDMFNQGLKHRVDTLCHDLAGLLGAPAMFTEATSIQSQSQSGETGVSLFVAGGNDARGQWWPADLGAPSSAGAQNDLRYAWFAAPRRLAIRRDGQTHLYDTGEHVVSGFSQQQGGDQSLTFTSQLGVVRVADLPEVSIPKHSFTEATAAAAQRDDRAPSPAIARSAHANASSASSSAASANGASPHDILATIERLADLMQKGILTDEEFAAKKAELLARI